MIVKLFTSYPDKGSGVVGLERMGTAFPHKKLSGNGVPTRLILRYLFIIAINSFPTEGFSEFRNRIIPWSI